MLKELGREIYAAAELLASYRGVPIKISHPNTVPVSEFGQWFVELQNVATWIHHEIRALQQVPRRPSPHKTLSNKRRKVERETRSKQLRKEEGRSIVVPEADSSCVGGNTDEMQERYLRLVRSLTIHSILYNLRAIFSELRSNMI